MKKKMNPKKKPVNYADVIKAKKDAENKAIEAVWAIFFSVMKDKEGWGKKRLSRLWSEVNDLSDSIVKGYVSVSDLKHALKIESNIVLE